MATVSQHPDLVREREHGSVNRSLARSPRLRSLLDAHKQSNGGYELSGDLLDCFKAVFFKAVQGLFYGLYQRLVPKDKLVLISVEDRRFTTPDEVVIRERPSPLQDITDEPLPEITPAGRMVRQPIIIVDLKPLSQAGDGRDNMKRVFRLVRDTPVEWIDYQPGVFTFCFVGREDGRVACIFDLWDTLIVVVSAPWPGGRGPMRRGRSTPWSRER